MNESFCKALLFLVDSLLLTNTSACATAHTKVRIDRILVYTSLNCISWAASLFNTLTTCDTFV